MRDTKYWMKLSKKKVNLFSKAGNFNIYPKSMSLRLSSDCYPTPTVALSAFLSFFTSIITFTSSNFTVQEIQLMPDSLTKITNSHKTSDR